MGLFSFLFKPAKPDTKSVAGKAQPYPKAMPKHDPAREDWKGDDAPIFAAPEAHVAALVRLFQREGRYGTTPHWQILASYPEVCWVNGFKPLKDQTFLHALSQTCPRSRPYMDRGDGTMARVICYSIPGPHKGRLKPKMRQSEEDTPWPEMPARAAV